MHNVFSSITLNEKNLANSYRYVTSREVLARLISAEVIEDLCLKWI